MALQQDAAVSPAASPETIFFSLVNEGNWAAANVLLQGVSPNTTNLEGKSALHLAARSPKSFPQFKLLLDKGADPHLADGGGATPLICAADAGNGEVVQLLLEKGVDVGKLTNCGEPAVFFALKSGHVEIARMLEEKQKCLHLLSEDLLTIILKQAVEDGSAVVVKFVTGASCHVSTSNFQQLASRACELGHTDVLSCFPVKFDQPIENGNSPLCSAVRSGSFETVKYMLDNDCDVSNNRDCVKEAVKANNLKVLELLRKSDAKLYDTDEEGLTPVQRTICQGSVEMFKYLLSENCSTQDHEGFGSLALIAAKYRQTDILRHLVEQGQPVDKAHPITGDTPLLELCQSGPIEAIELLINNKCNCSVQNKLGVTPALRAAIYKQENILMLLAETGAQLDIPSQAGETAILRAGRNGALGMVRFLAGKQCSLRRKDAEGKTLAHYAAEAKYLALLKLLSERRVPLDEPDYHGETPLMVAFSKWDDCTMSIVEHLTSGPSPSCNINQRDCRGRTAAHMAVASGRLELVMHLKDNGAVLDTADCDGNTLLMEAAKLKDSRKMLQYLIESGSDLHATNINREGAIHLVCMQQVDSLTWLLGAKAPADIQDRAGLTPFMISAKLGNQSQILTLKAVNVDINKRTKLGRNASHMAAESGSWSILNSFSMFPCTLDQEDCNGITPLIVACSIKTDEGGNSSGEMAKFLIDRGADPNAIAHNGRTSAHFACEFGSMQLLEVLQQSNCELNVRDECLVTPFMLAAKSQPVTVLNFLCDKGSQADLMDVHRRTALHYAVEGQNEPVVKFLVDKGLDPNWTDALGMSPVMMSIRDNSTNILKALMAAGGLLQEEFNSKNQNAAHFACQNKNMELLRELRSKQISLSCPTDEGDNCLTIASASGCEEIVLYLLEGNNRPHIGRKNNAGNTALIAAAKGKHWSLVQLLLSHGASAQDTDNDGNSALHIVCNNTDVGEHAQAITALLSAGAHADAVNREGKTALHLTCAVGNWKIAELLLSKGSDVDRQDNSGERPILCAIWSRNADLVELLIRRGASLDFQNNRGVTPKAAAIAINNERLLQMIVPDCEFDVHQIDNLCVLDSLFNKRNLNHLDFLLKGGFDGRRVENGKTLLHHIVALGDGTLLNMLVQRKDTAEYAFLTDIVDRQDSHGNTPLHLTIALCRLDMADLLGQLRCKPDLRNHKGFTPLHVAVRGNKVSTVEWLFEGFKLDASAQAADPGGGISPLHLAAITGSITVFAYLEGKGFSASQECNNKNNCAHYAASYGNLAILEHLEKKQQTILTKKNGKGLTPLQCAVLHGHENAAQFLYNHIESSLPEYIAHLAIRNGHQHMVNWLQKRGASLSCVDEKGIGETSLWHAVSSGNFHLVKRLSEAEDLHGPKTKHEDSLPHAAARANHEHLLRFLHRRGVQLDVVNLDGDTALMECALMGHLKSLRMLHVCAGCDLNRTNAKHRRAAHLACIGADRQQQQRHLAILQYILNNGLPDILDEKDDQGNTALMYASHFGHNLIVDFLLAKAGCDPTKANNSGTTAAHLAARAGHSSILAILSSNARVNLDLADNNGTTPLMIAVHFNRIDCVATLLGTNFREVATNNDGWSAGKLAAFASEDVRKLLQKEAVQLHQSAGLEAPPDASIGFEISTELCNHPELRRAQVDQEPEDDDQDSGDEEHHTNFSEHLTYFGQLRCRPAVSVAASVVSSRFAGHPDDNSISD